MSKIYLARHGQDEDNANGILNGRRDTPLTTIGIQQAQLLAEKVLASDLGITKVYSSPLQRAFETARKVSDALGLDEPVKLELLIERDFGTMTGKPQQDITRLCAPDILKTDKVTYFLSPEGAETFPQLILRAKQLLMWLAQTSPGTNVLLVSHGDIGKMIYAAYYQLDWRDVLVDFHFGNSEILLLAQGSKPEDRHIHKTQQHNH